MIRARQTTILLFAGIVFFALVLAPYALTELKFLARDWTAEYRIEPKEEEKDAPDFLQVPRLGIAAPIVRVDRADEVVVEEALQRGVVHYPDTAEIGELGNAYLFGHSSDFPWAQGEYKSVFEFLPKIAVGDEIAATDREGRRFVYRVIETAVVSPGDMSVLDQRNYERRLLSLQTSYPVGTAFSRFISVAELVEE